MADLGSDINFKGFWGWASERPDATALIEVDGRTVTYGELAAGSNQIANGLRAEGAEVEDCIAVLAPNCIEMIEAFLGAFQVGVYFTTVNHYLAPPEIAYILENCDARILIIHERYRDLALAAIEQSDFPPERCLWIGDVSGGRSYAEFKSGYSVDLPSNRVAGQTMMYSSGTTGQPKGIRPPLLRLPRRTGTCRTRHAGPGWQRGPRQGPRGVSQPLRLARP